MTAQICTCNARDCGPGAGHESYCGRTEEDDQIDGLDERAQQDAENMYEQRWAER
jgi:hypothetical protein